MPVTCRIHILVAVDNVTDALSEIEGLHTNAGWNPGGQAKKTLMCIFDSEKYFARDAESKQLIINKSVQCQLEIKFIGILFPWKKNKATRAFVDVYIMHLCRQSTI